MLAMALIVLAEVSEAQTGSPQSPSICNSFENSILKLKLGISTYDIETIKADGHHEFSSILIDLTYQGGNRPPLSPIRAREALVTSMPGVTLVTASQTVDQRPNAGGGYEQTLLFYGNLVKRTAACYPRASKETKSEDSTNESTTFTVEGNATIKISRSNGVTRAGVASVDLEISTIKL